jgi:hypothetical protein
MNCKTNNCHRITPNVQTDLVQHKDYFNARACRIFLANEQIKLVKKKVHHYGDRSTKWSISVPTLLFMQNLNSGTSNCSSATSPKPFCKILFETL